MMSVNGESVNNKRPKLTKNEAIKLVEKKYGIIVINMEELNGYDDRNFKLESETITENANMNEIWPYGYVLKIINSEDSKNLKLIEAQSSLMLHLHKEGFNVPRPVLNKDGNLYSLEELTSCPGVYYVIKLLTFEPGVLFNDSKPSAQLYKNVGTYLADINTALETFQHEGYKNYHSFWDLSNVREVRRFYYALEDKQQLALVEQHISNFEQEVLPLIPSLEKGIIHGDFNEHNLLTEGDQIKALLDFGDAHYAPYLFELAICICYMLIHSKDITCGRDVIKGYTKRRQLTGNEEKVIKTCVCARLCQSLVLGLHSYKIYKIKYVLSSHQAGWNILSRLTQYDQPKLKKLWQLN